MTFQADRVDGNYGVVEPVDVGNAELRELWKQVLDRRAWPRALGTPRWPMQYPAMRLRAPLFVGLNPSHSLRDDGLLAVRDPHREDLTEARGREVVARENRVLGRDGDPLHAYYRKFDDLAGQAGWNHVDLIAVRHTNQAELKSALGIEDDGRCPDPFVNAQIDVVIRLVSALEPTVVVVVNAFAATMVQARQDARLEWDDNLGHHVQPTQSRPTPWFFSGMLTGQRALDNHSFRRLRWHVRRALRGPLPS